MATRAASSTTPVVLYSGVSSSSSWRVRICLALKKIKHETVWLDSKRPRPAQGISPTAQVPALRIDGQLMCQSVAICEYLEETHPSGLLPPVAEAKKRAQVREFVEIMNSGIQPLQNSAGLERLPSKEFQHQWASHFIEEGLKALEIRAAENRSHDYLFEWATNVTLAEVFLVPQMVNAARFGVVVDDSTFPRLSRVFSQVWKHHPEFAETAPQGVPQSIKSRV